jgi:hypothetical protein
MSSLLSDIETQARRILNETTASFWSSAEIIALINLGIKDLWRDIADLKQEHFLAFDETVTLEANTATLTDVPVDVHKIYLIEPLDASPNSANRNLVFKPLEYNHALFQSARTTAAIEPLNATIFYAPIGPGAPTDDDTTVYVAPQVTAEVAIRFVYVPTLEALTSSGKVPIPGEADNALIAWTIAYARAKERDDRSPDPAWLAIYSTEKLHLLTSLGLRQYQEPTIVDGIFDSYWS